MIKDNTVLTESEKEILSRLPQSIRKSYVLGGGTALSAFYLNHRHSDDLDFFAVDDEGLPGSTIEKLLKTNNIEVIRRENLHDRRIFLVYMHGSTVKMEFVPSYFERLDHPLEIDHLQVESLNDIIANKVIAMTDRYDLKDYIDIFYICEIKQMTFGQIIQTASRKYRAQYYYLLDFDTILKTNKQQLANAIQKMMIRPTNPEDILAFYKNFQHWLVEQNTKHLRNGLSP